VVEAFIHQPDLQEESHDEPTVGWAARGANPKVSDANEEDEGYDDGPSALFAAARRRSTLKSGARSRQGFQNTGETQGVLVATPSRPARRAAAESESGSGKPEQHKHLRRLGDLSAMPEVEPAMPQRQYELNFSEQGQSQVLPVPIRTEPVPWFVEVLSWFQPILPSAGAADAVGVASSGPPATEH